MPETRITVRTPGKLMIAGEFAVLVPHHQLMVMAVDRFVNATIESSDRNYLTLDNYQLHRMPWKYRDGKAVIQSEDTRIRFVENAITVVYSYLEEQSISTTPCHLAIRSDLDDASGAKYGLGSSAAVVTSVVTALLRKHLPYQVSGNLIFKLAAIAHVSTQGNGSGADIAASVYGGLLTYTSFQADWLLEEIRHADSTTQLVEKDWIYWRVEKVQPHKDFYMSIGWTGSPASTKDLVNKVLALRQTDEASFREFLEQSTKAVEKIAAGAKSGDMDMLIDGMKQNRQALAEVGSRAGAIVETHELAALCDMAERLGGAGKPSGAGGGDCGLAVLPAARKTEDLEEIWESGGIRLLPLKLYPYGSMHPYV